MRHTRHRARTTAARPATRPRPTVGRLLPVVAALALVTAGCGSAATTADDPATTPAAGTSTTAPAGGSPTAAAPLVLRDGWVKAAPSGMTAMFGTLHNDTGQDVTVTSATSPQAGRVELHEVAMVAGEMQMRPKDGGFVVPAGGDHSLAPGGDHLMLLALPRAIEPGEEVTLTLSLSDGSSVTVSGPAKEFAGGNESYHPTPPMGTDGADPMASAMASGSS